MTGFYPKIVWACSPINSGKLKLLQPSSYLSMGVTHLLQDFHGMQFRGRYNLSFSTYPLAQDRCASRSQKQISRSSFTLTKSLVPTAIRPFPCFSDLAPAICSGFPEHLLVRTESGTPTPGNTRQSRGARMRSGELVLNSSRNAVWL